jgi:hypothetical protein
VCQCAPEDRNRLGPLDRRKLPFHAAAGPVAGHASAALTQGLQLWRRIAAVDVLPLLVLKLSQSKPNDPIPKKAINVYRADRQAALRVDMAAPNNTGKTRSALDCACSLLAPHAPRKSGTAMRIGAGTRKGNRPAGCALNRARAVGRAAAQRENAVVAGVTTSISVTTHTSGTALLYGSAMPQELTLASTPATVQEAATVPLLGVGLP